MAQLYDYLSNKGWKKVSRRRTARLDSPSCDRKEWGEKDGPKAYITERVVNIAIHKIT